MRFLPLAALLLMAACGQQTGPAARAQDPAGPASIATTPASATTAPTASTSSPASTPVEPVDATGAPTRTATARPAGLRGRLLGADELPGSDSWRATRTGREGTTGSGSCQLTDLVAIGATSSVRRTFADGDDSAVQVVAKFADDKSAWRTFEVLKSWRAKCSSRLVAGSTVSPLANVGAAPAVGHRYTLAQPVDASWQQFERVGLVRLGEYVSLVAFVHTGDAVAYPAGQEPEALAVRAIAQLLGTA